ncbi:unnamed protein product [Urochloa humidicola]
MGQGRAAVEMGRTELRRAMSRPNQVPSSANQASPSSNRPSSWLAAASPRRFDGQHLLLHGTCRRRTCSKSPAGDQIEHYLPPRLFALHLPPQEGEGGGPAEAEEGPESDHASAKGRRLHRCGRELLNAAQSRKGAGGSPVM